jgi:hypothetical protein
MRPSHEVDRVLGLVSEGRGAAEISRLTGIPRSTVRGWRDGRLPRQPSALNCLEEHLNTLDGPAYAYLLGIYLGDGCISEYPRGVDRLRITLDAAYPGIVDECASALEAVAPGKRAYALRRRDQRTVEVSAYWKDWRCLLPQPGRVQSICVGSSSSGGSVASSPRTSNASFVGSIHSDGTRIVATERKRAYVRRAPRYAFKNRSHDILELFRVACEMAGIHCTRASESQIAVYGKAAVARLDEFVGPKR